MGNTIFNGFNPHFKVILSRVSMHSCYMQPLEHAWESASNGYSSILRYAILGRFVFLETTIFGICLQC
jgi:hypothetical protein